MTAKPKLVAIGGYSGAGKSLIGGMVAKALSAEIVEIDWLWKKELGLSPTAPAPPGSYTPERHQKVLAEYDRLTIDAIARGKNVLLQKIFVLAEQRDKTERIAQEAGADFYGFWLDVPVDVLKQRVSTRQRSVSDAPGSAIDKQMAIEMGVLGWPKIDATRKPEDVLSDILRRI